MVHRRHERRARRRAPVSFSMIDASVSTSCTRHAARGRRAAQLASNALIESRHHRADRVVGRARARRRDTCPETGTPRGIEPRIVARDAATGRRRARRSPPMSRARCARRSPPISAMVRPSGNVTACVKTSPAASRASRQRACSAPANRYSPALQPPIGAGDARRQPERPADRAGPRPRPAVGNRGHARARAACQRTPPHPRTRGTA